LKILKFESHLKQLFVIDKKCGSKMSDEKKFALKEYSMLGDERRHLEETQLKYLSMCIAATALLFAYAATSLKPENGVIISLTFIVPIFLIIPVWIMFLKKAQRLTYLAGYEQIIESYLLGKIEFSHYGIENTIKGMANRTFFKYHFTYTYVIDLHQNLVDLMQFKEKYPLPTISEFNDVMSGDLLLAEKRIKSYLGYRSWTDLRLYEKLSYFMNITFRPDRTGTYWLIIYRICFMLTYVSVIFSFIAKSGIGVVNQGLYSYIVEEGIKIFNFQWDTIGTVIFFSVIMLVITYIIIRITSDHYELQKGIFSYESNYDLWCVILSVKKK
jgi:hypothetical protein